MDGIAYQIKCTCRTWIHIQQCVFEWSKKHGVWSMDGDGVWRHFLAAQTRLLIDKAPAGLSLCTYSWCCRICEVRMLTKFSKLKSVGIITRAHADSWICDKNQECHCSASSWEEAGMQYSNIITRYMLEPWVYGNGYSKYDRFSPGRCV